MSSEEVMQFKEISGLKFHEIIEEKEDKMYYATLNEEAFENMFIIKRKTEKKFLGQIERKPSGFMEKVKAIFGTKYLEDNYQIETREDFCPVELDSKLSEGFLIDEVTSLPVSFVGPDFYEESNFKLLNYINFDGLVYESLEEAFADPKAASEFMISKSWIKHDVADNTIYIDSASTLRSNQDYAKFISLLKKSPFTFIQSQ
jgi:hypothetical protein